MLSPIISIIIFSSLFSLTASEETSNTLNILMPNVVARQVNDYLCASFELDKDNETYITGFEPAGTSDDAHHMLLFGCTEPGSEKKVWNCTGMVNPDEMNNERKSPCASGLKIIYAWALDADKTELPKDVAFKVGGSTSIKYLVLQVHYSRIDKFQIGHTDRSGFLLTLSPTPTLKRAGILMLYAIGGRIQPNTTELFEIACEIQQDITMHPFAFRAHTHGLGLVNSGYRVRGKGDEQVWTEIGRRSPQLPQMFYPTKEDVPIKKGDYIAAVCTMFNTRSHIVRVGPTSDDEMCSFYAMYWVDDDRLLNETYCRSAGPPNYYFQHDRNLNVNKIPEGAYRIPPPPNGPEPDRSLHSGYHMIMPQNERKFP